MKLSHFLLFILYTVLNPTIWLNANVENENHLIEKKEQVSTFDTPNEKAHSDKKDILAKDSEVIQDTTLESKEDGAENTDKNEESAEDSNKNYEGIFTKIKKFLKDDPHDKYGQFSDKEMFEKIIYSLEIGKLSKAEDLVEGFELVFPTSDYSSQVNLIEMYLHLKQSEFESIKADIQFFNDLYPSNKFQDYLTYIDVLADFGIISQRIGVLFSFFNEQLSNRTTQFYDDIYEKLQYIIKNYPDSEYAKECKNRIKYINNLVAKNKLLIAKQYFDKKIYIASINICVEIFQEFSKTESVIDALEILTAANKALGFDDEASLAENILKMNFPDYELNANGIQDSYKVIPIEKKVS
jgi:outer membrane protein assembly factor BamD